MKLFADHRFLAIAVTGSVLIHAALLGVHFAAPDTFRLKPTDPGLEVILVNARHDKAPLMADAVAQANLDGGGNASEGRASSPLPDMRKLKSGDGIEAAQRAVAELEARQQKVLAQMNQLTPTVAVPEREKTVPRQPSDRNLSDAAREMARLEAEVARNIEDYNKRPKKTQITARTRKVDYAFYYKRMQEKIEILGTLNFPHRDGRKLYGELLVYIPVFQDGTIYEKEGGARVERSSGDAALDSAALAIVRRSAPFGGFPKNMRTTGQDDIWEIITRFRFTHDESLQIDADSFHN
ncbi:MAG: energy transducer TonB [Herbaspirillum sp.]